MRQVVLGAMSLVKDYISPILNYSKMGFDCKFQFELNNVQYFIERKAKKGFLRWLLVWVTDRWLPGGEFVSYRGLMGYGRHLTM